MVLFETPLYAKILGTSGIATLATASGFFVWTKHCDLQALPVTDPLFTSPFYKKFNPNANPSMNDVCVRRIPLYHIRPDLLDDSKIGGGKMVEAFCGGVFGGNGYTIQRLIHGRNRPPAAETSVLIQSLQAANPTSNNQTDPQSQPPSQSLTSRLRGLFSSTPSTPSPTPPPTPEPQHSTPDPPTELWTKPSLQTSTFPTSTIITNHFLVLSRTPTTILLRCGDSPLTSPHFPRNSDGLFEISAVPNFHSGYAEFTLKSIFYDGSASLTPEKRMEVEKQPMSPTMRWLHEQYTKLWMESGVGAVRMSKWRSFEKQRESIEGSGKEVERREGRLRGESGRREEIRGEVEAYKRGK